ARATNAFTTACWPRCARSAASWSSGRRRCATAACSGLSMISDLEKRIGYTFQEPALLERALTHASLQRDAGDNERLEFLGDRVLGLAIAGLLYRAFDAEDEGDLAKRHTALVQQAALVDVARALGLPALVKTGGAAGEAS